MGNGEGGLTEELKVEQRLQGNEGKAKQSGLN